MKISKKILKFLLYVFLIVNYNSTNATSSVYTDDLEKYINRKTIGTKNFFESLIKSKDIKFFKLRDYKKLLK